MSDLERIISLFQNDIESINIADYIEGYELPSNKNQQWIDKLEFSMEAGRNWDLEVKSNCILGDYTMLDNNKRWRALISEELYNGNSERYEKMNSFLKSRQKFHGSYTEPRKVTEKEKKEEEWMFSPYNPDYCPRNNYVSLWDRAFEKVNEKYPGQFKKGNIKGKIMTLERVKCGSCMISGKKHSRENSYLVISENSKSYKIAVGCNRGCKYSMRNIQLKNIGTTPKDEDEMD